MALDPQFPVGGPTASGTTLTSDQLLAHNGRIVGRAIRDTSLQKMYIDKIFGKAGKITGGSQVYEQALVNEIYAERDVQRIEPLTEYPEITFARQELKTATVEKYGGKFTLPDESVIRHKPTYVLRRAVLLANTIRRKTQLRAMFELDTAIASFSRTVPGLSWQDALALTSDSKTPASEPLADLAKIQQANEDAELGYEYNFAIFNTGEVANMITLYGSQKAFREVLAETGIMDYWSTPRQAAGTAKFLAKGLVGELGYEEAPAGKGWSTTTGEHAIQINTKVYEIDDPDATVVKANVKPIVYVTDPHAIIELTGLRA